MTVQHEADRVLIAVAGGGSCQHSDDGEVVAAFLSALDPRQLEKEVLAGLGALEGDGESNFTQALLKRLVAIARGEW